MLGFLRETDAVDGPDPFPVAVLESLRRLVPCDLTNFCELDQVERRIVSDAGSDGGVYVHDPGRDLSLVWWAIDQLPVCIHRHQTGTGNALRNSDFMTSRELRASELWEFRFKPFGKLDELSAGISRSRRHTKTFLFHADREFEERDRLVLDLLRPHLAALYSRAAERRRAAASLAAFEAGAGETRGAIVIDSNGRVELMTATARRLAAAYFDAPPVHSLTEPLASWLQHRATYLDGDGPLPAPAQSLVVARNGRRLVVSAPSARVLLLEEESTGVPGLTRREREVLDALAGGDSNAEIAVRLSVSPGTVRKHLENIYEKLGVHTRTAAVARAVAERQV